MSKQIKVIFFTIISILFAINNIFAIETLYIQSESAKVLSGPSFDSQLLLTLSKGYKVDVLEKTGSWVKVRINSREGYISSFLLGKTPPIEKVSQKKGEIKEDGRKRVSEYTTAIAGVRGLTEEDRRRLNIEGKVNYEALEKIEKVQITKDDINKFLEESKR